VTPIDEFFGDYAERYMALDADAVAGMCETPFLAVREGRAIHLADARAVRDHFAAHMDAYAIAGAARIDLADLTVRELGTSSALATVRWHARAADGSLLREFSTSYHLLRAGDSWRILSYTNHDA
jgi:ketosteroid isomerase-like protein